MSYDVIKVSKHLCTTNHFFILTSIMCKTIGIAILIIPIFNILFVQFIIILMFIKYKNI